MEKNVKFEASSVKHIDMDAYDNDDYMIARTAFLSTRPNCHDIVIPEDVLREYAPSVLGKWVTAEVKFNDCTTHTNGQSIVGIVPKEQDVEFVEADDGYIDAYVDCIISKRYAKEYCNVFSEDDATRSVSIEATFSMVDEHECDGFNIKTITTLGKAVRPSVPDANITIIRFSEEDAESYYNNLHKSDSLSNLKQFVEERKQSMAEKYVNHPINTSKDAVYTGEWDGDEAKKNLVKEKNYKTLAPKVCLRLEEGWEDREVTKLGYPVMGLYDGEWRYSTKALSSALAYAKQNDETEVVNKIEAIYKKLDLDDDSERKEEAKMEEVKELAPVETEVEASAESALEEKKEEMAEPEIEVKAEECECEPDHDDDDEHEKELSCDELKAKMAELEKDIESRDNIIMEKDAELEELRKFKAEVEEQRKAATVESIMAECKEFMSDEQYKEMREEGMACKMSELDGWTNKAKAVCFSAVKKNVKKTNDGLFRFAAPIDNEKKSNSVWDRI